MTPVPLNQTKGATMPELPPHIAEHLEELRQQAETYYRSYDDRYWEALTELDAALEEQGLQRTDDLAGDRWYQAETHLDIDQKIVAQKAGAALYEYEHAGLEDGELPVATVERWERASADAHSVGLHPSVVVAYSRELSRDQGMSL